MVGLGGHEDVDIVSDAKSAIRNISVTKVYGDTPDDEIGPQGRMFFWRYLVEF